jgi:hypothetical protein
MITRLRNESGENKAKVRTLRTARILRADGLDIGYFDYGLIETPSVTRRSERLAHNGELILRNVYIAGEHRGNKHFPNSMRIFERFARVHGCGAVVMVDVFNEDIEQWANRNGFSKVGARRDFVKYME